MSSLTQLTLPVKNTSTGEVSNQTFDLPAGGTSYTELTVNVGANATSASFTDTAITSSATFDVYTSVFTNLTGMSISGTTLTVNFKAVSSAMQVKLRIS